MNLGLIQKRSLSQTSPGMPEERFKFLPRPALSDSGKVALRCRQRCLDSLCAYHVALQAALPMSTVMSWCFHPTRSIPKFCRQALSWRSARMFCMVWFALASMGFPLSLSSSGKSNCAVNPGQQCHCSLAKRMSGTCCCGSETKRQVTKSCCSVKQSVPKLSEPATPSCCSSKSTGLRLAMSSQKVELSISRCDCGSGSPDGVSLAQEPRLPVTASVLSLPDTTVAFIAIPIEWVESAPLQPPVPPPKIVL